MGRATNANAMSSVGSFSTARRGGLSYEEIRQIEAHRAKDRPTPFQSLAQIYGRPVEVIKALFEVNAAEKERAPEPANDERFEWDARKDKLLRLAYGEMASSAADVAKMIGCTKAAVIGRAYRLGVKHGGGR